MGPTLSSLLLKTPYQTILAFLHCKSRGAKELQNEEINKSITILLVKPPLALSRYAKYPTWKQTL